MKNHEKQVRRWYKKESGKRLSDEEVRACMERMAKYGQLLIDWDKKQAKKSTNE